MIDDLAGVKTGIGTVLREEFRGDQAVPGADVAVQLPLLPLRQVGGEDDGGEPDPAPRGVGRPAGSRNRSTEAWRSFLLSRYPSPLVGLAEVYSRSPQDIAAELGFTSGHPHGRRVTPEELLEIFKLQLQCMKEVVPYIHQKQPIAIEGGEKSLMQLVINTGVSAQQVEEAGSMRVNFIDVESESDQGLSASENQNSVFCNSVANGQSLETQEQSAERPTD